MKKAIFGMCIPAAVAAVVSVTGMRMALTTPASAFEQWSVSRTAGNCADCHGDFRAANYVSATDGAAWMSLATPPAPQSLHDGHRNVMLSGLDCSICHSGSSRFPVLIGSSTGVAGFSPIGCNGCHLGEGLRAKHAISGVAVCMDCHSTPAPSPENTVPPYYFTPDTRHPNKPTDPCNANASESRLAPTRGLDNDGNDLYDLADPACAPANRAPTAVNDTATTAFQTAVTVAVLTNDSDPDGNPLSVTNVGVPSNGAAVRNANNTIIYTPNAGFTGTDSFGYTISDGQGGTAQATVTVTVQAPANQAPTAVNDSATTAEDTPVTVAVLTNDSDPNGDTLTVTAVGSPANGTAVRNADNTITYTPNANFNGSNSFSYTISDGRGGTATATVTVTVTAVNDPPVANNDSATTPEDTPVTINVLANDSDPDGDVLTVTTVGAPANGTAVRNSNNTVTFTPSANFNGTSSFSYTVSDGRGGTATGTVTVTVSPVNDPPVANNDSGSTPEDTPVTLNVLANDSDSDGNPLTVTAVTNGANGSVSRNPDNTVTYSPNANFNGSDSFTYTVSDGVGGTAQATVSVTVTPVNDAPTAVNDSATAPFQTPVGIPVLANDTDVDGPALRVSRFDATSARGGTVSCDTVNAGGLCTYTPATGFSGADTFNYTASDGSAESNSATVTVTVSGQVNLAPVAVNDVATTPEDSPVAIAVLANDSDPNGDSLTVTAAGPAAQGTASVNGDGTIRYMPNPNFNGSDSFTYTISDAGGLTASATVRVTVSPVNDAPVANNDSAATAVDTAVVIPVLANDADADGDALTVTAVGAPTNGTAAINADNTVTYTPNGGFTGTDTFSYTVADPAGASATAAVTVVVEQAPNRAPVAVNDAATTAEDTAIVVNAVANDTDPDGDVLTITAVGTPANGAAAVNPDNTVTYTPKPNFNGTDQFTYTVSDPDGLSATGTVTVRVTPVNDAPVARDDAATTPSSATINVLANDVDPDGDPLTVTQVDAPSNGTAAANANGTITYTANAGFTGSDSFTYTISDPAGATSTASVTVTVQPTAGKSVDLDVVRFKVNDKLELHRDEPSDPIRIELTVTNKGKINEARPATVVGMQSQRSRMVQVYRSTLNVSDRPGGDPKKFVFPSCRASDKPCVGGEAPIRGGQIEWTATIEDDDPDADTAAATTQVKAPQLKTAEADDD